MRRAVAIVEFVWPPLAARRADKTLDRAIGHGVGAGADIAHNFLQKLRDDPSPERVISAIDNLVISEQRRREFVESKSTSLVGTLGVVVSLTAIVPAVLERSQSHALKSGVLIAIVSVLAVIHFLVAVYFSIKTIQVGALYLPSTSGIDELLKIGGEHRALAAAANGYASARLNEPILTKKSNYAAVAQQMYLRGIVFLAIVAIAGFFHYYGVVVHEQAVQRAKDHDVIVRLDTRRGSGPFE